MPKTVPFGAKMTVRPAAPDPEKWVHNTAAAEPEAAVSDPATVAAKPV